jgi:hypothetical protein
VARNTYPEASKTAIFTRCGVCMRGGADSSHPTLAYRRKGLTATVSPLKCHSIVRALVDLALGLVWLGRVSRLHASTTPCLMI